MRIVIADDEKSHRTLLQAILISLGYKVVGVAQNGAEAVKMAMKLRPDIVILDVVMPEMGGIEAARKIKLLALPLDVVIYSSLSHDSVREEALSAGASDYIQKPPTELERLWTKHIANITPNIDGSKVTTLPSSIYARTPIVRKKKPNAG
jgi:two-component system chemotaxis response regulator CheY